MALSTLIKSSSTKSSRLFVPTRRSICGTTSRIPRLFPNHVYKLKKALYGLKKAPRSWYERLSQFLIKSEFHIGNVDSILFVKISNKDILFVQIYVDDILLGSTNLSLCKEFSTNMQQEFEMFMMGKLTFSFGLKVKQTKHGILIHQAKYCAKLLKQFSMDKNKESSTPMVTNFYLDVDEGGKYVDQTKYRGMIGSLLYLTTSRPNIMHNMCVCARF